MQHLEFIKLAKIMETKGLKILWNVKIQWINMLEPLKWVMVKYETLIMRMSKDNVSVVQARFNLDLLCDLHILGFFCLLPLLEVMNALIKFAQKRDIFSCDFVAVVKIYQTNLYMIYLDPSNNFLYEHF
jgi:hypothetical protein